NLKSLNYGEENTSTLYNGCGKSFNSSVVAGGDDIGGVDN
ncbi:8329_t:CDS:1, partial [Gigaspora rosea]